ncbi:MAG: hypothetical protein M3O32_17740 [Actinomycetota bacterium]|nr:hypothetical protein [Actinomycetota bacterium]
MTEFRASGAKILLNKVPQVTLYFWLIKVLATTVGETAADYLSVNLGLGLTGTTYATGTLLLVVLALQLRSPRYIPVTYWVAVVLLSVFGTLITDNLVDNFRIPLETTTAVFAIALAATFGAWYLSEKTLSITTIHTTRRELFYWAAILFTFALGTAGGDLLAEGLAVGYAYSVLIFAAAIAIIALAHFRFGLNGVFAFWAAYVLTRPLGASLGDLLSQESGKGGLGWGSFATSLAFLATIASLIVYLSLNPQKDVLPAIAAD